MFARQLIGPAAELSHLNLLAEVSRERRLALAAAQKTSPGTRSGRSFSTMALHRIVHAARSLRTLRATGDGGSWGDRVDRAIGVGVTGCLGRG
jgi:hypothetical protein